MTWPLKLAASALLAAVIATGCASAQAKPATVTGCARFAIQSVQRHETVHGLPAACRGLRAAELRRAVRITVSRLALTGYKSVRRHEAARVRAHLAYLVSAARREAAAQAAARRSHPAPPSGLSGSIRVPIGLTALIAWLVTVAVGAYLLGSWLLQGPHRRPGGPGAPPAVAFVHLGFAVSGLVVWAAYLISNVTALAWASLGLLLPVAVLGMATLLWRVEDPGEAARAARPAPRSPGTRHRPQVLLIAAHGALATLTVLLALLGAIAAVTAH